MPAGIDYVTCSLTLFLNHGDQYGSWRNNSREDTLISEACGCLHSQATPGSRYQDMETTFLIFNRQQPPFPGCMKHHDYSPMTSTPNTRTR